MESLQRFEYQLLGRLQQDCEYYLGAGSRNSKHLWAHDESLQIKKMKELYESLVVKPEWISLEAINVYEEKMVPIQREVFEKKSVHPLVGRRVLNVHRQSCDMPQSFRDAHKGVITDVIEGCNALVVVQFDGRDSPASMVPGDLAFCELWPAKGCRVDVLFCHDKLPTNKESLVGTSPRSQSRHRP